MGWGGSSLKHTSQSIQLHISRALTQGPTLPAPLHGKDDGAFGPGPREPDHLAVVHAARVRAPAREVIEYLGGGDESRVGEENLRVWRRLM
jgi:hypothetical protein